jgi:hypothetical protein
MNTAWSGRVALVVALVAPVGVAAALVPFRNGADSANVALVLVAFVVAMAALGGRLAAALSALTAVLSFDFFHARPFESLSIDRRTDLETALLLVVVGLIAWEVSSRSARHRIDADQYRDDIARIHAVVALVSEGATTDDVIMAVRNELRDLLFLRDCTFSRQLATRPRPELDGDGEVMMAGLRWGASRMGLPSKEVDLIVHGRGRAMGRFILVPTPGVPVAWDRRLVAVALADQVGAALVSVTDGHGVR